VMLMEYVDGATLLSRLQSGPIPPADAINYSEQILSALGYAHKLNVIHRDVKPSNMMLAPDGVVKLMDFGIARPNNDVGMTLTGTTLGSLNYMSPEQVRGSEVDARSDVYSFGVSLYEMVTGQLPFQGNSNYSVMSAHVQQAPPPPIQVRPDLPKGLNEIILMSMAKDPQDRFQTAEAFANALKTVLGGPGVSTAGRGAVAQAVPVTPSAARTASTVAVEPVAVAAPPARVNAGHRGLYMALGGLLVVAILVAASLYVPHHIRTHASPATPPAPVVVPPAEPATATPSDTGAQSSAPPAGAVPVAAPPAHSAQPSSPPEPPPPPQDLAAAQAAAQQAQEEAARKAAELKEAAQQADQLDARAAAVSQSLDNLRRQQAAQGYGLRGDMAAAEELMKTNLSRAHSALDEGDGARAKEYLAIAEAQAEKLEKFLGR
jgi:eukaryotic-like serine/threonine-protein kinase